MRTAAKMRSASSRLVPGCCEPITLRDHRATNRQAARSSGLCSVRPAAVRCQATHSRPARMKPAAMTAEGSRPRPGGAAPPAARTTAAGAAESLVVSRLARAARSSSTNHSKRVRAMPTSRRTAGTAKGTSSASFDPPPATVRPVRTARPAAPATRTAIRPAVHRAGAAGTGRLLTRVSRARGTAALSTGWRARAPVAQAVPWRPAPAGRSRAGPACGRTGGSARGAR